MGVSQREAGGTISIRVGTINLLAIPLIRSHRAGASRKVGRMEAVLRDPRYKIVIVEGMRVG